MLERFTERAKRVMELAGNEARRLNHEYVGTEHILPALIADSVGVGANVLKSMGVELSDVRREIDKLVKPGPDPVAEGKLPLTPRVKKLIEYSIQEASNLNHNYVGTEHLLLGLVREHEGVGAQVLMDLGLKLETIRKEVLNVVLGIRGEAGEKAGQDTPGRPAVPAAAVKYVNRLLQEAVVARASDIHLDTLEDRAGRVRLRSDGVLNDLDPVPRAVFGDVLARIKTMSALNPDERGRPQIGRISIRINDDTYDLRVSTIPTLYGERITIRILRRGQIRTKLEDCGLGEEQLATVRKFCHLSHGLVIVSGPAGSGKTTVVYCLLNEIDRDKQCVISIEDPVELALDGVAQIQVDPKTGLTYLRAMREVMRQDPDVILVGEIRDAEIVEACLCAAETGHLVLTSTHASTGPEAVRRLLDLGIEPYRINASLKALISLRLVRTLCPQCKRPTAPPLHSVPPQVAEILQQRKDAVFFERVGCQDCNGTGYRGRTGIFEILEIDDTIRRAVSESGTAKHIAEAAAASGVTDMLADGLEKAARGITTIEEVVRVAPHGPAG